MIAEKNWYAVYTRARWEKKISDSLTRKNIVNYCPLNKVVRKWSDRKKTVFEPLFRGYVFVQVSPDEMVPVMETDGVLHFVHWLKKPAVIKDVEIELIRKYLNEYDKVEVEKIELNINDKVRIVEGPLLQYEGSILSVNKHKVKIYLNSLQYVMIVEVDKSNVEAIDNSIMAPAET